MTSDDEVIALSKINRANTAPRMKKMRADKKAAVRKEGWGNLDNARDAHYFAADGRSLCARWLSLGPPRWESNQELGEAPTRGTCKTCWKKRAKQEGKP